MKVKQSAGKQAQPRDSQSRTSRTKKFIFIMDVEAKYAVSRLWTKDCAKKRASNIRAEHKAVETS